MINFQLKDIDEIHPSGTEGNYSMSWFWLTDGDLWLDLGESVLYEYTKEALEYFENKPTPYSDYPIIRFIEDFTGIFKSVAEDIPVNIFALTSNIEGFEKRTNQWDNLYDANDDEWSEFHDNEYTEIGTWLWDRCFNSGHLINGPHFYLFKHKEVIRIVWKSDGELEGGIRTWTARSGFVDMSLDSFIKKVKDFGLRFFKGMDGIVSKALEKDWGDIAIDKNYLVSEHSQRKADFDNELELLTSNPESTTNWNRVALLVERMDRELKTKA